MSFFALLFLLFTSLSLVFGARNSCSFYKKNSNLPCYEVPNCERIDENQEPLIINKLSNGLGPSKSTSDIYLCHDNSSLKVKFYGNDQNYLYNPNYSACNDPVFNNDVFEFFVSPYVSASSPHCYNELDISPFNVMFQSGIYNPNLNHTAIQGNDIDCATTGIQFSTAYDKKSWTAEISFPFSLLNCPYKCPVVEEQEFCGHNKHVGVYHANFYRINELSLVTSCSSSTCEYNAWSPTLSNPPAFHEPTKFGLLVMMD